MQTEVPLKPRMKIIWGTSAGPSQFNSGPSETDAGSSEIGRWCNESNRKSIAALHNLWQKKSILKLTEEARRPTEGSSRWAYDPSNRHKKLSGQHLHLR